MKQNSYTFELSRPQQAALIELLKSGNYVPRQVEHAIIAAAQDHCTIALYKSGKCLVQGRDAEDFVTFVLEPMVLGEAKLGYDEVHIPETLKPHMGIDESGKGDFFGPLVISAAYADKPLVEAMKEMGVKDSKKISSDNKALEMARDLKKLLNGRFSMVVIGPRAYNRLYSKMRNVNRILAWGHARAIENLLEKVPDCPAAVSDQFGSKDTVKRALMHNGRRLELVERVRAESDPAVAAASVLARAEFLSNIRMMTQKYGLAIKKGASEAVKDTAVELVRKNNPAILLDAAKCHFKTTDEVLAKLGVPRSVLGPEGAAISRPKTFSYHRHAEKPAPSGVDGE